MNQIEQVIWEMLYQSGAAPQAVVTEQNHQTLIDASSDLYFELNLKAIQLEKKPYSRLAFYGGTYMLAALMAIAMAAPHVESWEQLLRVFLKGSAGGLYIWPITLLFGKAHVFLKRKRFSRGLRGLKPRQRMKYLKEHIEESYSFARLSKLPQNTVSSASPEGAPVPVPVLEKM